MARNYSDKDVYSALEEIEKGATIAESARKYGIPRTTLSEKRSGRHPIEHRMGPDTVLSQEEENLLQKWIFHIADAGFPITKDQLLDSVQMILNRAKRETIFTDNRPGRKWYDAFRRRHPLVVEKEAQNLNAGRASITEENLRGWYTDIHHSLTKMGNVDILNDPERIFNMDESGFYLTPSPGKELARKGQRRVYSKVSNDEKEMITVLIGGNAKGILMPSLVLFAYQRLPANIVKNMPESWAFGRSPNGWMTCEAFYEYITNCFHPWLVSANIKLPIVLFVDGHSSHISYHLSEFCAGKGIILIGLFPNATHLHQPMDVSVFHSMKTKWAKAVQSWRMKNDGGRLSREKFASLLKEMLDRDISKETVANGFTKSGLYPFNADAIDYGQLIKKPKLEVSSDHFVDSASNDFLERFEQHLDPSILLSFKKSSPELNMQSENSSLYRFWKQIGGCSSSNFVMQNHNDDDSIPEDIIYEYVDGSFGDNVLQENGFEIVDLIAVTGKDEDVETQPNEKIETNIEVSTSVLMSDMFDNESNSLSIANESTTQVIDSQVVVATSEKMETILLSSTTVSANVDVVNTFASENNSISIANVEATSHIIHESQQCESNQKQDHHGESIACNPDIPDGFPNYFKDVLFWPGRKPVDKSNANRNQNEKENIPAVLIFKDFREYLKKKEDEKERLEIEKADRKVQRELKKIEKLEEVEQKEKGKAEREIEKQRKEEEKEKEKQRKETERAERAIAKQKKKRKS